ncbi:hypothetical protein [Blastococcus sp. LR1]|uniref:hypothetical protein n=1 Tax=Blastococcus sp. LR1 TaxID=2877000 RepID=UPI001CCB474B|nr:hypothetical protein [Blastococcus sp. LR1]MCA0146879.1 hypothetical protein [Blastococcus sp. LR1]
MTLTFRDEVRGPAFLELLLALTPRARTVGLVQDDADPTPAAEALAEALGDALLRRVESRSWPGSEIPDWAPPSVVRTYRYDDDVARTLYRACPAMYRWQARALPVDLHLTDGRGRTVLGTTTSEDDTWVDMRMAD